jgi:hypothetical protein
MKKIELPKLFNKSDIARALFPNNVDAPAHLLRKLSNSNGQSLNENDKNAIIEYAEKELKKLKNILK